ncbi:MAG: TonB-dependent receptor plug domain-containing protein, partial [Phycisphaerae bacterium]
VLVLVDGRQIFDSHFGGTLWGIWPFQLEDIERIEVVRGPGGVTWGANAVNGAINIITKDPRDQLGLTYTAGGGSRGTYKTHLGYAFEEDKLRMRISGEYEASDGYIRGGSILRRLDDEAKTGRMNLHAIYEAGPDDTWTFSAGSGIGDGGFAPTPLAGFGLRRNSASQSSFLLAKWRHQVAKDNAFELTGYVNDSFGSPGVPAIDYRYQQLALQFGHTFKRNDTHTVSWGIDGRADLLDATNSDPFMLSKGFVSTGIVGLYLQDEWRFAPKWTLNLGGRIDYEFYGGFQPSARAALSYELSEDSMIYGAVSRAFQMSPAGLRFLRLPMLNGIVTATGNRNVAAETLIAYELGYRGRIADRLDLNLNLFWHELDDLTTISPRLGPPGLIRMAFGNHAEASMYGAEFDAKYRATDNLTLLANYTFQELDWRADVPLQDKDTISPPEHKAMVGARYSPSEDLHLSSHLYWVDFVKAPNPSLPFISNRIEPYFRLDVVAEQELWDDRASIAVGVRNLLDSGHFEGSTIFMNDAEVPRMVFAEFRLRLQ